MAKKRLNQDEIFKSIIGKNTEDSVDNSKENKVTSNNKTTAKTNQTKEKLIPTAFYITEKQRKAMKLKAALGYKPEDKDLSSIARAALDIYLADILKDLK